MYRRKLLIIDEDPLMIQTITEYLGESKYKFELLHASSADLSLDISQTALPDLIMVNCELSDMSASTILKKLKTESATANVPVIVTASPLAFVNDLYTTLSEWPVHYLAKPINQTDLNIQVNTALALSDPLWEIDKQKKFISYIKQFTATIMDSIPSPLFYENKDGSFFGYNRALGLLCRKNRDIHFGLSKYDILPAAIAERLATSPENAPGDIHFTAEVIEDNEIRYLMVVCSPFYNSENDFSGRMGAITDITGIVAHERQILSKLNAAYTENEEAYRNSIEKLHEELNSKQRELSIHLGLLKNAEKAMDKMLDDINTLQPYLNDEGKTKVPAIAKRYKHKMNDDSWLTLQAKFEETNNVFFEQLEKQCPNITKTEKILCAYLKMNLSSSEISKITRRSLNSINVAFARLRTKLKLKNNKELKLLISNLRTDYQIITN